MYFLEKLHLAVYKMDLKLNFSDVFPTFSINQIKVCNPILCVCVLFIYVFIIFSLWVYHCVYVEVRTVGTSSLPFLHVAHRDGTRGVRGGSDHLWPLSHLPTP